MPFSESQKKAVMHTDGPMLVLAGPGSGKTTVITERTARLTESGVSPSSVLVVTFTRAAAAEMKGRFLKRTEGRAAGVAFGTFHSVFYGILRTVYRFGPGSILTESRKLQLLGEILNHTWNGASQEADLPAQVAREISSIQESRTNVSHFYSAVLPQEVFRKVYSRYESWKEENRCIDFDDIIVRCYRLFQERPEVLERWQERFHYILVDEFQDISPLQYDVVRMLAAPQNNLFIVGDDDQSIYRFRGATPAIMLGFRTDYPDADTVVLAENYRSTPEIIRAAGRLIAHNKRRYPKDIRAVKKSGRPVELRVYDNPMRECMAVADEMREEYRKNGTAYREMAVLARTNAGCRQAAEQMLALEIPFRMGSGMPCIFDHWIAKDLLAYLDIGAGSTRRTDYLRICNKPNRYLSREAFHDSQVSFYALYDWYEDKEWMCRRLQRLEDDLGMLGHLSPYGAVTYIRKEIGYEQYLREYALERRIDENDLIRVLDELTESAKNYRTLDDWKESMEKFREKLAEQKHEDDDRDSVTIATLHASKGTEYDDVWIIDVNEGSIPYHKAVLDEELEEERRMLYVGMTRARKQLTLCQVRTRYDKKTESSRFLKEIFT